MHLKKSNAVELIQNVDIGLLPRREENPSDLTLSPNALAVISFVVEPGPITIFDNSKAALSALDFTPLPEILSLSLKRLMT